MRSSGPPTHDRAEEYRRKARACVSAADRVRDEDARIIFLDLAMHWMRLADSSEAPKAQYNLSAVTPRARREQN